MGLSALLRSPFYALLGALKKSTLLQRIAFAQQKIIPFPLRLFRLLATTRYVSTLFYPYGYALFRAMYDQEKKNFWLEKESLYWHFLNERKANFDVLDAVKLHPVFGNYLFKAKRVVELGAGVGKQASYLYKSHKPDEYVAIDPNRWVLEYNKVPANKKALFVGTAADFFNKNKENIDLFMSFDGVFEYLDEPSAKKVFAELKDHGCGHILITLELKQNGSGEHLYKDDGTIFFDFELLAKESFPEESYQYEKLPGAFCIYPK